MISHFMPLSYTNIGFGIYQPKRNVRDENVWSRNGFNIAAEKIISIEEIVNEPLEVVGIDEIHMFEEKDAATIEDLLKKGIKVVASGLDMDYRGEMFPIVKKLFELSPQRVDYKRAVCELCKKPEAIYTQLYQNNIPILGGLPPVVPEDGTYEYKPVCRHCFKKS